MPSGSSQIPLIRLFSLESSTCPLAAHAGCPPNSVQVGEQKQRVGNVIIVHQVCQWLAEPRPRYIFNAVPALPRVPPEVSDSSVKTALARARAFLLQKAGDVMFSAISGADMTLSVMHNATRLPDVIFLKISEAAAMSADPDSANMNQANAFSDRMTVKSVRTLLDVGGGRGEELAGAEGSGGTLFSAFFPKAAGKAEQAVQTAPTWMPDIKRIIGIWAPAQVPKAAQ